MFDKEYELEDEVVVYEGGGRISINCTPHSPSYHIEAQNDRELFEKLFEALNGYDETSQDVMDGERIKRISVTTVSGDKYSISLKKNGKIIGEDTCEM